MNLKCLRCLHSCRLFYLATFFQYGLESCTRNERNSVVKNFLSLSDRAPRNLRKHRRDLGKIPFLAELVMVNYAFLLVFHLTWPWSLNTTILMSKVSIVELKVPYTCTYPRSSLITSLTLLRQLYSFL